MGKRKRNRKQMKKKHLMKISKCQKVEEQTFLRYAAKVVTNKDDKDNKKKMILQKN